ncbi:hypothetical protein DY000_02049247 [Brassica cretica]|uniref:Uncharacterized protein n=1 Tax=Brassica cretica TaxID=69181 RepID=A0ABQ7F2U9_BRACR|nr:hypothetical protein DY000_02049247 [Brassica cretica]
MRLHETRVHRKTTIPTNVVPRFIPTNCRRRNLPTDIGRRNIPTNFRRLQRLHFLSECRRKVVGKFRRTVGIPSEMVDGIPTTSFFWIWSEICQYSVANVRRPWCPSEDPSELGVFSCGVWSLNKLFHRLQLDRSRFREVAGTLESISSTKSGGKSDIIGTQFVLTSLAQNWH